MATCDLYAERLTLHAWGDLDPAEARQVEAHLASCDACAREHADLASTIARLDPSILYPREGEVDWDRFAAETAARARRATAVVPFRRRGWLRPAALARAAAVVLAVGLGALALWVERPETRTPPAPGTGATALPGDFQDRLEMNLARADTREYLAEGRLVLLNVLEAPVRCSKQQLDIAAEREKAMQLLRRKKLLGDDLGRPELARAAALCDELEGVLTEISTLDDCADVECIQELRDAVRRRQLLVKIGVAEGELGGFRA
jgi:hypothetical protein